MTRILITSALPYINGVKHLGNLVGSMLPADVYARFQRARGRDTLYICATDEHGTPAELAAHDAGQDVAAYCAEQHEIQKKLGEGFGFSWDYFGRSSSPQNRRADPGARPRPVEGRPSRRAHHPPGLFQCRKPLPARPLRHRHLSAIAATTRPAATSARTARACSIPTDLKDPRSALSDSTDIEIRDSAHLFLKQSEFVPQLRQWIDGHAHDWSPLVLSIARKWLDEGLQDRGITRDLEWGVPVPDDIADGKLKGKVFYVWFDAPIEYIGATREWADAKGEPDAWKQWWYGEAAKQLRYVEFMGKDNVPFHTVGFPVTLMGAGPEWKLVDRIKGFNWLNYYGGKFSTSGKRGVFMDTALEILPADTWRYYLMANAPESADTNFTWEHFASVVNKDLADVLGNFVNRVTKFCVARFDGRVPGEGTFGEEEIFLARELDERVAEYTDLLEAMEFRKAFSELRAIWVAGNEYLTRAAPWTYIKSDRAKAAVGVRMGLNLVHLFGHLTAPVIPTAARVMHEAVMPAPPIIPWPQEKMADFLDQLEAGMAISVPHLLFAKISDEQIAEWTARFGGEESA